MRKVGKADLGTFLQDPWCSRTMDVRSKGVELPKRPQGRGRRSCPAPPWHTLTCALPPRALSLSLSAPSWLLQDPKMVLRTTYSGFVKAVDKYFDHLISRVVPLQVKQISCSFFLIFALGK